MSLHNPTKDTSNENWMLCNKCGEKLLIDPYTSQVEPCAACRSRANKTSLFVGLGALLLGLLAVGLLVAISISALL